MKIFLIFKTRQFSLKGVRNEFEVWEEVYLSILEQVNLCPLSVVLVLAGKRHAFKPVQHLSHTARRIRQHRFQGDSYRAEKWESENNSAELVEMSTFWL